MHVTLNSDLIVKKEPHDNNVQYLKLISGLIVKKKRLIIKMHLKLKSDLV